MLLLLKVFSSIDNGDPVFATGAWVEVVLRLSCSCPEAMDELANAHFLTFFLLIF